MSLSAFSTIYSFPSVGSRVQFLLNLPLFPYVFFSLCFCACLYFKSSLPLFLWFSPSWLSPSWFSPPFPSFFFSLHNFYLEVVANGDDDDSGDEKNKHDSDVLVVATVMTTFMKI